jgi:hypothetical protein
MSSETISYSTSAFEEDVPYRVVSKSAVTSLALGLLSVGVILFPELLLLPALGVIFAVVALRAMRRYPEEITGKGIAVTGLTLGLFFLLGGSTMHAVIYATEVPPDHERVSFQSLRAPTGQPDFPPPEALELDGKKVFLRGYIHPSVESRTALRRFILVPDLGTCCFGGQPPLTHMIEVTVKDPEAQVRYSMRRRGLAGVLHVDTRLKPVDGLQGVYYRLDATHIR